MKLKTFIAGAAMALFALPLSTEVVEIVQTASEWLKSTLAIKVIKNQETMRDMIPLKDEDENVSAIGFHYENMEDDDEE